MSLMFAHAFIFGHILYTSFGYSILGEAARFPTIFLFLIVPIGYFSVLAFFRGQLGELFIMAAVIVGGVLSLFAFSTEFNRDLNLNALAPIYSLCSFLIFFQFVRDGSIFTIVRVIFLYSFAYTIIYLAFASIVLAGGIANEAVLEDLRKGHLLLFDTVRGDRAFLASFIAGFTYLYALAMMRDRFRFVYLAVAVIALAAIGISLSRVFIVVIGAVSLLYLVRVPFFLIKVACFTAFVAISAYFVYSLFDRFGNPFDFGVSDDSTAVRRQTFEIMKYYIPRYAWGGVGFPSDWKDFRYLFGGNVDPTDLGAIGVWFMFGIVGVVLYIGSVAVCAFQQWPQTDPAARPYIHALILTGCALAPYSSISPDIWWGSGSIFLGIAFAKLLNSFALSGSTFRRTINRPGARTTTM